MSAGLQQFATQEPPELHWFERANYIAVNVGLIAYGEAATNVSSGVVTILIFYFNF